MTRAGLPVPPGLIVTTEACNAYYANNKQFPDRMWEQVTEALHEVEKKVGKKFGDAKNPLLVSVRSGAAFSMPGMMDTVLNLGLNEETVTGLAEQTGDLRFALDAYRRFASLFGEIVIGVAHEKFERVMDRFKAQTKGGRDTDLKPEELRGIIATDVTGDGLPDIAVAAPYSGVVYIFVNQGGGTFGTPMVLPAWTGARGLALSRTLMPGFATRSSAARTPGSIPTRPSIPPSSSR